MPAQFASYRNPIVSGFNPDPSCITVGDSYFLVTSSFEFFPGVPIYHSTNLVDWELIGHALTRRSQLHLRHCKSSHGIYAATIREHRGRFYVTTVAHGNVGEFGHGGRGFYVWTDNIWDDSTWSDPVFFDQIGIDQDLFFNPVDNKVYLTSTWSCPDIYENKMGGFRTASYVAEIDLESGRSLHRPVPIRDSPFGKKIAEGAHIYFKDGWYYLITAEGGTETNHQQWVCRSRVGPYGPWKVGPTGTVNPMVFNGNHHEVRCTGHMDLFEGVDGQWWAVFLAQRDHYDEATRSFTGSQLGRETFLAPVEWVDDWPIVNDRQPITVNGISTNLPRTRDVESWRDDFDGGKLSLGWYHLRTPQIRDYSLKHLPNTLTLYGGPLGIRTWESPTILLRKQKTFVGVWSVVLDFEPTTEGEEAGTVVWRNEYAFGALAIRLVKSLGDSTKLTKQMVFRYFTLESEEIKETHLPISFSGPVHLKIKATTTAYEFFYGSSSSNMTFAGFVRAEVFAKDYTPKDIHFTGFTGAHIGVYAEGPLCEPSFTPAHFSKASWQGRRAGGA